MDTEHVFHALAETTRLRIMRLVATMELAVGEVAQVLGQSQPRVSRHVAILCDAGLTERRREGSWVFLRATTGGLAASLCQVLDEAERHDTALAEICAADRRKLAAIRAARENLAQDYFAAHAEDWDGLRRLHSTDERVEAALAAALAAQPVGRLLDVGTGTGRIAEMFAATAESVVALDKSPAMLRVARARLQHLAGTGVEMIHGDFTRLPLATDSVDTVIFHQVLHFAHAPEVALNEAARVTRAGGRIAIVDFAAHQREELRARYAHVRLGFEDAQIAQMMRAAGFTPAEPVALEGGVLVVKIWIGTREHAARRAA